MLTKVVFYRTAVMPPWTAGSSGLSGRMTHFSARTWTTQMTGLTMRLTEGSGTILLSFSFPVSASLSASETFGVSPISVIGMEEVEINISASQSGCAIPS